MNTKAIIASTLFTAVVVSTSAFAQQDNHRFDFENIVKTDSVQIHKVSVKAPVAYTDHSVLSGKK